MKVGLLIPLEENPREKIAYAVSLGIHCGQISVWDMRLYRQDVADAINAACKELDFTVTALWCGWSGPFSFAYPQMYSSLGLVPSAWRAQRTQDLLNGAAFARSIGVSDIVTHLGYVSDDPYHPDRMGLVQAISYICRQIAPYGQRFLFETGEQIPNTLMQIIAESGVQNVGINFDPANFLINGRANPSDAMDRLVDWVGGFHAKDGVYATGFNPKGKETQIGKGQVDFTALLKKLKDADYPGTLTIEREITESPERDRQILEEKEYLESILRSLCTESRR